MVQAVKKNYIAFILRNVITAWYIIKILKIQLPWYAIGPKEFEKFSKNKAMLITTLFTIARAQNEPTSSYSIYKQASVIHSA